MDREDKVTIDLAEDLNLFQPLDPELNYYDATPAIEAMCLHMRGMYAKIVQLETALGMQASINSRMMQNQQNLHARLEALESKPKSAIIMPGRD